jgi:hypothetical protein
VNEDHHGHAQEALVGVVVAKKEDQGGVPEAPVEADLQGGRPKAPLPDPFPKVPPPHELFPQGDQEVYRGPGDEPLEEEKNEEQGFGEGRGGLRKSPRQAPVGPKREAQEDGEEGEGDGEEPGEEPVGVGPEGQGKPYPLSPGEKEGHQARSPHVENPKGQDGGGSRPHPQGVAQEGQAPGEAVGPVKGLHAASFQEMRGLGSSGFRRRPVPSLRTRRTPSPRLAPTRASTGSPWGKAGVLKRKRIR